MLETVKSFVLRASLAVACVLSLAAPSFAQTATLPDVGVDVGEYITAAGTDLGAIVLIAIGLYFAFLLVRMGLRWGRKMAG